ncbi:MAG: YbaN family protein [Chloroflexus sp.]|uniref:YbaN family protein n=1 Tax=Chloroflexus sp. TaxID=1904827 RepID=UPI00404A6310
MQDNAVQKRRNSFLVRVILLTVGSVALLIAALGLVIPGLPTTPFILIAAACYIRSSERLYRWLVTNRFFGPVIETWRKERGLTLRTKLMTFVLVWCMLGGTALFLVENVIIQMILIGLAVIKTFVLIRLRTVVG